MLRRWSSGRETEQPKIRAARRMLPSRTSYAAGVQNRALTEAVPRGDPHPPLARLVELDERLSTIWRLVITPVLLPAPLLSMRSTRCHARDRSARLPFDRPSSIAVRGIGSIRADAHRSGHRVACRALYAARPAALLRLCAASNRTLSDCHQICASRLKNRALHLLRRHNLRGVGNVRTDVGRQR